MVVANNATLSVPTSARRMLFRWLVVDDPLLRVYVTNEEAGERGVYENTWGCPVEFSSATAALEFPVTALALRDHNACSQRKVIYPRRRAPLFKKMN